MSQLDDELEQALREGEKSGRASADASVARTSGADVASPVVSDAPPEESSRRGLVLLGGLGVIMAGILALFFTSSKDAVTYAYGVDELQARIADLGPRQVRVMGHLVSGTLVRRDTPCEYRFKMTKGDAVLPVSYAQCVVPDTFRDVKGVEVEVTAEGRMTPDGHLEASKIMAKCPSKYEMKEQSAATGVRPQHESSGPGMAIIPAATPAMIAPKVEEGIR
jgi:cytochrome c-type biogenesis protein CcmE